MVLRGVDTTGYSEGTVEAHLKSLGDDPKVVDKRKTASDTFEVLCTIKDASKIPPKYSLTISEDPVIVWEVLRVKHTPDQEAFTAALEALLNQYGKSREDITSPASHPKHHVTIDGGKQYRRLRQFSGREPTPNGELPYETWRQLAEQMVAEPTLTAADKKARVVESLIPPALGILRGCPPEATAQDLLRNLRRVYGAACDGEDLYSSFRAMYQEQGERPSTYLTRLDEKLQQVIEYEGIVPSHADRARLAQFIRGCIYDEPLVYALQLRQKKENPPDFVSLLHAVRAEEEEDLARNAHRHRAKKVHAKVSFADSLPPEGLALAKRVEELTSEVARLKVDKAPSPPSLPAAALAATVPPPYSVQQELDQLKQLVHQLQAESQPKAAPRAGGHAGRRQGRGDRQRSTLCYQCGEYGHMLKQCSAPANAQLVQQRLVSRFQGNEGGRPRGSDQASAQY